jgi:hypothetical protein
MTQNQELEELIKKYQELDKQHKGVVGKKVIEKIHQENKDKQISLLKKRLPLFQENYEKINKFLEIGLTKTLSYFVDSDNQYQEQEGFSSVRTYPTTLIRNYSTFEKITEKSSAYFFNRQIYNILSEPYRRDSHQITFKENNGFSEAYAQYVVANIPKENDEELHETFYRKFNRAELSFFRMDYRENFIASFIDHAIKKFSLSLDSWSEKNKEFVSYAKQLEEPITKEEEKKAYEFGEYRTLFDEFQDLWKTTLKDSFDPCVEEYKKKPLEEKFSETLMKGVPHLYARGLHNPILKYV